MIDWASKIQKDGTIDLQGLPYYHLKWDDTSECIDLYEYKVHLPSAPEDKFCINYGLDEYDQIWRNTYIPKQVRFPGKDYGRENWTQKEIDSFIDAEWNRRLNGVWMFIKGKKTYIPGLLYLKMNYWKNDKKMPFIYKSSDWEFFIFWMHCLRDPKCKGMVDFKCRQVGATENAIIIMWEYGSRVRGAFCANQSCINENHAKQTYNRLVNGHKNMIYFFRPLNQGTEDPKKGLKLSYPAKHNTYTDIKSKHNRGEIVNKSSHEDYEFPEIGTEFRYGPSKANEFDGYTLGRAYLDEFAKSDGKINPVEWIQVIKEATYSNILGRKMGMILMTSTAEDIGSDSLAWAQTIWRESDPNKRKPNGETTNGLYRCFRNVVARGATDRWGFPKEKEIIDGIKSSQKAMMEAGNNRGAISYMRKNPITIEDVFRSASDESQFDVEKLIDRQFYITEVAKKPLAVRGNLKWKDNVKDSEVIWEPNSKGRWLISRHPEDFGVRSNAKDSVIIANKPGNMHLFSAGCDPVDQSKTLENDDKRSKLGLVVMRRLDKNVDGSPGLWHQTPKEAEGIQVGDPVNLGENHETNRVCCTYLNRDNDVSNNFEDVILTLAYYGTDMLPEKQKMGALQMYMTMRGYQMYITDKPSMVKNAKGQSEKDGVTATNKSFNDCFSYIETFSAKWTNTLDHEDLISQLLTMNWANRGEKDLGVAFGWALYHANQSAPRRIEQERDAEETIYWEENAV